MEPLLDILPYKHSQFLYRINAQHTNISMATNVRKHNVLHANQKGRKITKPYI